MAASKPRAHELRTLPDTDLQTQLQALRHEMWEHRMKAAVGSLQQPHQIRALRRQVARVQTVLNEQRRAQPTKAPGSAG